MAAHERFARCPVSLRLMERPENSSRLALLVMLLLALVLVLAVFRPLGAALFLAAVMAMVMWPAHQWLTRKFGGRDAISAGLLVTLFVIMVLGPLVWLSTFIITESMSAIRFVTEILKNDGTRGLVEKLPQSLEDQVNRFLGTLETGDVMKWVQQQATRVGGSAAAVMGAAVSATGALLFQGVMMVLALFFLLTNKQAVINWLDNASPLRPGQTRELFSEFMSVCKSVIVSTAVTALVQSIVAMVGYFIVRLPYPVFFFALTFICAFIPAVGAAAVCLLGAGILLVTGHPWSAVFLSVYGVVVVGLVDNVVKPLLMKEGAHMHGAVVFFALLGGLSAFGAMGLLIGPLGVALFLAMLRMYKRDYASDPQLRKALQDQDVGSTQHLPAANEGASKTV